jgi:NADH-quinone oxidoreductase subunit C
MSELFERLQKNFDAVDYREQKPELAFVAVPKDKAEMTLRHLRDHEGYAHLSFFTTTDYIERGVFRLIYMLHNYETKHDLGVHVEIDRENAVMESIHELWAQAKDYQREMKEMYGIDFPGSPGVDDNFMLEGWKDIPPMRKEFDTHEYVERTFFARPGRKSYDPRTYMKEKLYPDREE